MLRGGGDMAAFFGFFNGLAQQGGGDGFYQKIEGAPAERLGGVVLVGGDENGFEVKLIQCAQHLEARLIGQPDIEKNKVWLVQGDRCQAFPGRVALGEDAHLRKMLRQEEPEYFLVVGLVFNNQGFKHSG